VASLAICALAAGTPAALAHTGGSTGYASIVISGNTVQYSLTLSPSVLPPAVAEDLVRARSGRADSRDRLLGHLRDKLALTDQGRPCEPAHGFVEAQRAEVESVTLVMDFACAATVRDLVIHDDLFDVLGPDHHTLARVESPGVTRELAFATEAREARISLDASHETSGGAGSFVLLGVEHILTGYDHLLFLLALLLRGGRLVSLLKIITAFTLAHSVTLALAVLDVVVLPDRLVEAVIALSIAFVAAENLFLSPVVARRWLVSFCFGLVHGFGFSSALRELGLPAHGLLLSLFGFNAGVEVGQAFVVALALPVLMLVRTTRWQQRVIWSSSLAILLVGVILFVERAFF
jgi:hypothetical protein